jgi:tetratricopeptide (TPR) repeat protein
LNATSKKPEAPKKVKPGGGAVPPDQTALSSAQWMVPVLIGVATFIAFLPVLQNGFVSWDDGKNLLENPNYRGLGWTELRWMFTTFYMGHYQPLSWLTLGSDYLLWGMRPSGYHLTSLLLHAANAVLFYFLTVRLLSLSASYATGELAVQIAAVFSAVLFAIHPLRVESVVWATERRDVLAGFFFLLTLLCYVKAVTGEKRNSARWLGAALIVYVLSLLSKATGMTLPLVLLVLDIYPLRRLGGGAGKWFGSESRTVWREKIPFLLAAVACAIVALLAQREAGALRTLERYNIGFRLAQALFGLVFYLWKTIIPLGLSPLYEAPFYFKLSGETIFLGAVIVLALSIALWYARHSWPAGLASWVFYLLLVAPVLGLAQSGPQLVADRYSYLSCLSWAILAGAGLLYCWRAWESGRIRARPFFFAMGMAGLVPVVLLDLTWKQVQVWHDSERLWRYVLSITPESSFAQNNLGNLLSARGELGEAMERFRYALNANPRFAEAHYNLGNVLYIRGELDEAMEQYREAVKIRPGYAEAHYNLGVALAKRGRQDEAIEHYREALRLKPDDAEAHNNLGNVLYMRGELDEAMEQYREAVRIRPGYSEAHYNLGVALARQGQLDEAIGHYRETLRLQPGFPEARQALSQALSQQVGH